MTDNTNQTNPVQYEDRLAEVKDIEWNDFSMVCNEPARRSRAILPGEMSRIGRGKTHSAIYAAMKFQEEKRGVVDQFLANPTQATFDSVPDKRVALKLLAESEDSEKKFDFLMTRSFTDMWVNHSIKEKTTELLEESGWGSHTYEEVKRFFGDESYSFFSLSGDKDGNYVEQRKRELFKEAMLDRYGNGLSAIENYSSALIEMEAEYRHQRVYNEMISQILQ